jgi:hypothetical protein
MGSSVTSGVGSYFYLISCHSAALTTKRDGGVRQIVRTSSGDCRFNASPRESRLGDRWCS